MREGWEYKKLGQVCTSDLGKTLNKSKDRGELHPYLCSINILWDKIDLSTLKQACFEADEQEKYTVRKGDLLVCEGGDTGRSAIWDRDETILYQNALHRLRFHESVSPKFVLFYLMYLKDIGEIDNKYSKGVTIKHLVKKALLSIPLPIPPKPTQFSIVSELDKLNELIRIKKEQLKDYDTLAQSIFYEMFGDPVENEKGWEVKQLKDVSTLLNGRAYKQHELLDKGKYKVLRVGNFFTNSTFYYSDLELDDDKYSEYGDLLFAWSASFGAFIWNGDKVIYHYHIWKVLFDKDCLDIQYYRYLLNTMTSFFMNDVHGIGMVHLTKSGMEQYNLPIPPLSLQHSFAHKIEQIERQKAEVQKTITDLETLLTARMQYWFD